MSREEHIAKLIADGMPPDLAPRALDAFENLLVSSETLLSMAECGEDDLEKAGWLRYGFYQGFVAGSVASVHHN